MTNKEPKYKNIVEMDNLSFKHTGNLPSDADILKFLKNIPEENIIKPLNSFYNERHYIIVYMFDAVKILKFEFDNSINQDNQILFNSKNLIKLRLFSSKHELYLWRVNGTKILWRFREDLDSNNSEYKRSENAHIQKHHIYNEYHIVWGTNIEKKNKDKFALVEKERQMRIPIPFELKVQELPLKYKVKNYFHYDNNDNGTGLIKFFDARLVQFCKKDINNKNKRVVL